MLYLFKHDSKHICSFRFRLSYVCFCFCFVFRLFVVFFGVFFVFLFCLFVFVFCFCFLFLFLFFCFFVVVFLVGFLFCFFFCLFFVVFFFGGDSILLRESFMYVEAMRYELSRTSYQVIGCSSISTLFPIINILLLVSGRLHTLSKIFLKKT